MDKVEIQQLFQSLSGLSDEEVLAKRPLLDLAYQQVSKKVKETVDVEQEASLLNLLVAVMAQYLAALTNATGASSIRVADIAITEESGNQFAQITHLKQELLALAAPLLVDDDFVFWLI